MSMPVELYITCQQIIIYCQRQKLAYLRNGKGLADKILDDEPQLADFTQAAASATSPTPPNSDMSLAELVRARLKSPDAAADQITVEEAIAEASQATQLAECPASSPSTATDANDLPKYTMRQRFDDWRAARREWLVKKYQAEYEYDCLKKQVADRITGYDDVIDYIEQLMRNWDSISAHANIADMHNATISDYDTIGG